MTFQPSRRSLLTIASTLGIGTVTFRRALAQLVEAQTIITTDMVEQAEWVAGIELSESQRTMAAEALSEGQKALQPLREVDIQIGDPPSWVFRPLSTPRIHERNELVLTDDRAVLPSDPDDLAFLPVHELASLVRRREVTSTDLTKLYLNRLRRFDPLLKCVVTMTDELALAQAEQADREIAAGHYRGPLHGIPWGAKDLLAYPGYPTTWGAPQYRQQHLDTKATVIQKLERAGAVLVAKLASGHYALGDQWFGGRTRNPWNPHQGSSGSSAGSAAATSAGLVGFSLGTETLGSIVSPARRCGATGLRPTFGRVSRRGCMPLAWSLDKIGPICRTVEDCALVLAAIHGSDRHDPGAVDEPFQWPTGRPLNSLRIGFLESQEDQFRTELKVLEGLGLQPIPVRLPNNPLYETLRIILTAESGEIFQYLTRQQEPKGVKYWPTTWAMGSLVTAADYLRATRVRRQLMVELDEALRSVDLIVGPRMVVQTNMTGHPQIVIPNGLEESDGYHLPTSLCFTGKPFEESTLLAVASAYQTATAHHLVQPPLEAFLADRELFHSEADLLDEGRLYP